MLNFNGTAALERSHIAVGGEAKRIPEANWCLNPKFIFERPQWRTSVEGPITPSGSSKAVLEEHTDDRKHSETTIGYLRC